MIPNPQYRGPWVPRQVRNPRYRGPWRPRQLPNPDYQQQRDRQPARFEPPVEALAFELWTVQAGTQFDNLLVGNDEQVARSLALRTWGANRERERASQIEAAKQRLGHNDPPEGKKDAMPLFLLEQARLLLDGENVRRFLEDVWDDWVFFVRRLRHNPWRALRGHLLVVVNILLILALLAILVVKVVDVVVDVGTRFLLQNVPPPKENAKEDAAVLEQVERTVRISPDHSASTGDGEEVAGKGEKDADGPRRRRIY
jgi:hypothetical protein